VRFLEPIGSLEMSPDLSRVVANIRDSERAAEAWPGALKSMTEALGAAGAACIVANKSSNSADWVCFSGLSERFRSDYVAHFARLDPFLPHLNVARRWIKLSDCLPQSLLRQSEWYNDFVLTCGVRDILGTRLIETRSHLVYVGVHQQIGRSLGADVEPAMKELTSPLRSAMLRQMERLFGSTQSKPNPKGSARRVRCYFHIGNGGQFFDETGEELPSREEAIARASVLAAELTKEGDWSGYAITVRDEDGAVVARLPV
jgi:hypothetical protein